MDQCPLISEMDTDNFFPTTDSWLDGIASYEGLGAPQDFLDELLSGLQDDSLHSTREPEPHGLSKQPNGEVKSGFNTVDPDVRNFMAMKGVPRQARPRHEIARLKKVVANLETMLTLLQQRKEAFESTQYNEQQLHDTVGSDAVAVNAWKGVAKRQHEKLCDSTVENQYLRSQVEAQDAVIRSLGRLMDRARVQLLAFSRLGGFPDVNASELAMKRAELAAKVDKAFDSVDQIATDDHFVSQPNVFRSIFASNSRELNPGDVVVDSYARHVVPLPMCEVSGFVWARGSSQAFHKPSANLILCQEVEEQPDQQILMYAMVLPKATGNDYMPVMALRTRRLLEGREATVIMATPLGDDGIEIAIHVIVQPLGDASRDSGISEVLVRMQCRQGSDLVGASESVRFRELAVAMQTTVHDDIQNRIDDNLLRRNP